jgi:2-phospho-L-lactate guanylyltransferase
MSGAATWVILPVKTLGAAKQRLAPVLPPSARRELVLAMLQRVLAAVAAVDGLGPILVVTPDPSVAAVAEAHGALILREARAAGLNAAVRRGLARAGAEGAARALVLPADVPLVTSRELNSLLGPTLAGGARVTLVPAADGEGPNAMLLDPPGASTSKSYICRALLPISIGPPTLAGCSAQRPSFNPSSSSAPMS